MNNTEVTDLDKYQFRPKAMAMGSLMGSVFQQVSFGYRRDGFKSTRGESYIAFDFKREHIAIRAKFKADESQLPPALRPLDAELAFDDIASEGIHIRDVPVWGQVKHEVTVTITCRRPPKFFAPFEVNQEDLVKMSEQERRRLPRRRRATALDFAIAGVSERNAGPLSTIPEGPCAYPTFWNSYRWIFSLPPEQLAKLKGCTQKFERLAEIDPDMHLMSPQKRSHERTDRLDPTTFNQSYHCPDMSNIRFSTRCLIEGLIAHGILKPGDVPSLRAALKTHATVPAFQDRLLECLYNFERIKNVGFIVQRRAQFLRRTNLTVLSHLVMIRTVLVTPTSVLVGAPQQEPSNSVTRRYADRLDGIIRVQFADEEDKLQIQDFTKQCDQLRPDIGIMARVRRALQHGLIVGGKRFLPVASSASQQKDHSLWFIDPTVIDGSELRTWMGSVDETIVAKHAARMGLPFSTSRIVDLKITIGRNLADVERGKYCFTDGVGVAGRALMKEAAKALGTKTGINAQPSAIQVRLGGAKGVLGCWPNLAGDHEVRLRPSMIKFQSILKDLNVVRLAKYQVAFLNRQFILIMCANGVPHQVIRQIFEDAVSSIRGMRRRVEQGRHTREDLKLMSVCSEFPLTALVKAGFNQDPLILDIISIIECRTLQDLKWRARVRLDGGVYLIGIADESGMLKEGEVFCQYQDEGQAKPVIVQSEVLVCRAPACEFQDSVSMKLIRSVHPGDIRRAMAVDCPALRHLKNVIVFSIHGDRDLPNQLGGGDLDGDDFTLIWDQRFVQPLRVHQPMDYTAPEPIRVDRVSQEHLNENFVQYIMNDVLGQVDNNHLALSDLYDPFHPDCLHLSEVHSVTGVAAVLDPSLRPKSWPDFMDKDATKLVYESQKILGQLFRIVQPDPHFRSADLQAMQYPVDLRITRHPVYASLIERLKPIKAQFESSMAYDMRRYRVTEPEIPSGIAVKNKRRKRARDQNLNEPLQDAYECHVGVARESSREIFKHVIIKSRLTEMEMVARHAYALTYEKHYVEEWIAEVRAGKWGSMDRGDDGDDQPEPMMCFAWVFCQELMQLAEKEIKVEP
ncbi:RNA dependent RNA polymerase-domain-containing protein [Kockovaella imperatae]|uniref:RNA-dependent RNA polymerase n=1 Tax=Kockovaella imperatae TaxID=4999 RepID=A0A1Y1UK67_9TREE|nr:RNA dependent RNA polymerase-domain-containing protein [Kockovaella imperatae]ORX38450.1 RNA dependent RNA polymerase-domain-containing protein [Kockovaella imperatae]